MAAKKPKAVDAESPVKADDQPGNSGGRERTITITGSQFITVAEHDALTANQARNGADSEWRQIAEARQVAMHAASARIAALEAECESLSRQLRSREINAEPAVTRPAWRWSPLL